MFQEMSVKLLILLHLNDGNDKHDGHKQTFKINFLATESEGF